MAKQIEIYLRDDDYCSYTNIKNLYDSKKLLEVFNKVYFGTIPYANRIAISYLPNKTNFHTLNDNFALCDYLKEALTNKNTELSLHGITHSYPKFPEFNYPIPMEAIKESKSFLEKKFETVVTSFSPPNNSLSISNYNNLAKLFKIIFYAFCPLPNERPFNISFYQYFFNTFIGYCFLKYQFRNLTPLRIKRTINISSFTFYKYDSIDSVFKSFQNSIEFSKRLNLELKPLKISIAIHYWELNKKRYEELFLLTDKIRDYYYKKV